MAHIFGVHLHLQSLFRFGNEDLTDCVYADQSITEAMHMLSGKPNWNSWHCTTRK